MFKKLYYLNTQRVLKIIGYQPSVSDEKKFLFSNYKMNMEKNIMKGYNSVKGYSDKGTEDLSKIIPLMD